MSKDMHQDIPDFIPAIAEHDWVDAEVNTLNGASLTFSAGGVSRVRQFPTPYAALLVFSALIEGFEYSVSRKQARLHNGKIIELPSTGGQRERSSAAKCTLLVQGHKPHWGPVLRATNGSEDHWVPIEVLAVEGMKATIATPRGKLNVYNHQPHLFATAIEFHETHNVVCCAPTVGSEYGGQRRHVMWVSRHPITACSKS